MKVWHIVSEGRPVNLAEETRLYLLNAFFGHFSGLPVCLRRNVKPRHVVPSCARVQRNSKWLCGSWLEDEESVFLCVFMYFVYMEAPFNFFGFLFTNHLARKKNHYCDVSFCVPAIRTTRPSKGFFPLPLGFLSQGAS